MIARLFTRRFVANYVSTLAFIGLAYWIVTGVSEFHRGIITAQWQFGVFGVDATLRIHTVLRTLLIVYVVALIPFYARYPWLRSKAHVFLQGLWFTLRRLRRTPSRAQQAIHAREPMRLPWRVGITSATKQAGL